MHFFSALLKPVHGFAEQTPEHAPVEVRGPKVPRPVAPVRRRISEWTALQIASLALLLAALLLSAASPARAQLQLGDTGLLPAEKAFVLSARPAEDGSAALDLHWQIAEGYYLYRHKFGVEAAGAEFAAISFPEGVEKRDPFFGSVEVYYREALLRVAVVAAASRDLLLRVRYQGCEEPLGVCYPPQTTEIPVYLTAASLNLSAGGPAPAARTGGVGQPGPAGGPGLRGQLSEQERIAHFLAAASLWLVLPAFIGFGLLLAFTPCVLPMIPLVYRVAADRGGSGSQGDQQPKKGFSGHSFARVCAYVLAMASTYSLAGVAAGLIGASLQAYILQPWVLILMALLLVAMALSSFGLFELRLPVLQPVSGNSSGSLLSSAGLGAIGALVVSPCVTPPLIGALLFIARSGDPWLGGAALFALGLGMGLPLLAFGLGVGRLLPRTDRWRARSNAILGMLLLALSLWVLVPLLPLAVIMAVAAFLLMVSGLALFSQRFPGAGASWGRAAGLTLLLWGALLLVGVASGGRDFFAPLAHLESSGGASPTNTSGRALAFQPLKGAANFVAELDRALQTRPRGALVMVTADWCISCEELKAFTFRDPEVQRLLADRALIELDVTANSRSDQQFLRRYSLFGPPALMFFDGAGQEIGAMRVVGYVDAERFAQHLQRL